ncbi:MAG: dihydrolipoyl dehydrogenase [Planctomycetes bacterium]|nr:dihydrolipoyl dehydrogenase [Planctomycetota bacterium]
MAEKFDIAVIGSGPGGYEAAIKCAQKNASVAIIEKEAIGGTCLNWGCIPSKALLASAHTLLMAKNAATMGIGIETATPDSQKIQERKNAIVARFANGMTAQLQKNKVKIIQGAASITAPGQIEIENDGIQTKIKADKIILASGSEPIEIPTMPFDGKTVISSKEALSLPEIPKSMIIVGGGAIGCELACVYAVMGTKVTIIEALTQLIPTEDRWVGQIIESELKKLGIRILVNQKAASIDKTVNPAKVTLANGQAIEAEKIMVAIGRRPAISKETIEKLDLKTNGKAIAVNEKMETNIPCLYAIGDVVGTTYLAHGAFAEARIAAENATGGDKKMGDYSLIPRAVYTFPEIASVGKSQNACEEEGLKIAIGKAFFKTNGKSNANNQTTGQVRVIIDKSAGKIIGITIVADQAAELIATATVLIANQENMSEIIFQHPTVSETLAEAVQNAYNLQ